MLLKRCTGVLLLTVVLACCNSIDSAVASLTIYVE